MGKYQGRVSALRISFPLNETLLHRKRTDLKIDMGNIQNDSYHIVSKGLKDYIRFEKQLEEFSVGLVWVNLNFNRNNFSKLKYTRF